MIDGHYDYAYKLLCIIIIGHVVVSLSYDHGDLSITLVRISTWFM